MERIREVIVVEGRYDAVRLHSAVNATVLETNGFGIFKDTAQLELLRRLAVQRGLLILTDSDGAGFVIRNFLSGAIPRGMVKHAYIPEIYGKERRKSAASREGLLGVEGMENDIIIKALRRAGATFENAAPTDGCALTKADLYADGLIGTAYSASRRRQLLVLLQLPEKLSANRLLQLLNTTYSRAEYTAALRTIPSPGTTENEHDLPIDNTTANSV